MMKDRYTRSEIEGMTGDDTHFLAKNEMKIAQVSMMTDQEIRNEALAWLAERGMLVEDGGVPLPEGAVVTPTAARTARVSYGSNSSDLPVAGMTVEKVLQQLRPAWGIDPNALVYLNGQTVQDMSTQVGEDAMLEFAKPAGVKGS